MLLGLVLIVASLWLSRRLARQVAGAALFDPADEGGPHQGVPPQHQAAEPALWRAAGADDAQVAARLGVGQAEGHHIEVEDPHHVAAEAARIGHRPAGHVVPRDPPLAGGFRPDGIDPARLPRHIDTLGDVPGGPHVGQIRGQRIVGQDTPVELDARVAQELGVRLDAGGRDANIGR